MDKESQEALEKEDLNEPIPKKLKIDYDVEENKMDEQKPSTSMKENDSINEEESLNDDKVQSDFKPDSIAKENARTSSRASLIEIKELYKEPAFAEICGFINLFGALIGIKLMPFTKIESLFIYNNHGTFLKPIHRVLPLINTILVNQDVIDLQIMLMRKIRITAHVKIDKWEASLIKFCNYLPDLEDEARQLERYGYDQLSISSRLMIFKTLCEMQFDCNLKFKENVRKITSLLG